MIASFVPPRFLVRALLAVAGAAILASCGSGGVSGSNTVNDPGKITILPSPATLYSGLPTTFQVTGGTGSYIATSSDQSVIDLSGALARGTFTVIPGTVAADTTVTLQVRDTGTTTPASATLTVKPNLVSNTISITPTSTQGGNCLPAICSGGDAEVVATLVRAGLPLANRAVRFEASSGDFRFITSPTGAATEVTDITTTVLTDSQGRARARVRVGVTAQNQTALLRVVDIDTGAFQTGSFTIAQATGTSPGFFASPSTVAFAGPNDQECASGGNVDVTIYGGTPPYSIASVGAAFGLSTQVVTSSGRAFTITPRGVCVATPGLPITITDATGRSTTVQASNVLGSLAVPRLVVSPSDVNLNACNAVASVSLAGGVGTYTVNSGNTAVLARLVSNNTIVIGRNPGTTPPASTSIGVSSGNAVATINVTITGGALSRCEGGAFALSTNTITLASCGAATVLIAGGTGSYTAVSNSSDIVATVAGNILTIQRRSGTQNAAGAIVSVSDGLAAPLSIGVNALPQSGACP